eukprot:XP_001703254.1 chromodomain-helicase-DNA-binding protein [Chlamydomonas reinhardtii]
MKEALSAFEDPDEDEVEDEVDKVLAHRDSDSLPQAPANDAWSGREFLVKWKRYSYIHCSWNSRAALEHLRGFKRVLNYVKKAGRRYFSREEQEMQDVEREMEAQLNQQHMMAPAATIPFEDRVVERVMAEKEATRAGGVGAGLGPDGRELVGPPGERRRELEEAEAEAVVVTKYLVKWEGLPYAECTWETAEDIIRAGGSAQIDSYLQREQRLLEPGRGVEAARKQFRIKGTRALERQPSYLNGGTLRDYQMESLNWMIYSWSENRNIILADEMGLGKTVQCVSFIGTLSEELQIRGPFLVVVPLSTVPNWIREFRRWVPFVNAVVYVGDSRSREVLRAYECDPSPHHKAARPYKFEVLLTTYELILKDAPILSRIKWAYLLELMEWHFGNKLLITGTPLQNSLKELWALLHFLEPSRFPTAEAFEAEYSLETADSVSGLHGVLRPHLLRRVIKDVEKSLPPKNERILRVDMTPLQKQYYKWILTRNFKELNKSSRGGGHVSLLNIIGELKKCCNHPFLFESAEDNYRGSEEDKSAVDRLIVPSGKMVLLDKLLRRLKATGHRVLIFSQMVRVLDIISDYMRLRGFPHQRLDGSTPAAARHAAMEHFNRPDSPDFAFLLSTRAGGLGINLATADTVIIFDSDWNPQNDLQAMSRAHRIGQTETVNIYRFVTSGSVEEDILERAKRKMVLDHLVIQRMDTSGRTILDPSAGKAGASAKQLFGKDELAAILRFGAEDLFKQAPPEDETASAERARTALYEDDLDAILERAEVVDTRQLAAADENAAAAAELLSAFNVATFKNEFGEDDAAFWNKLIPPSERPKEEEPGPPVDGAALRVDEWIVEVDDEGIPLIKEDGSEPDARSLSRRDAAAFVRAVRRYGRPERLADVAAEVGRSLEEAGPGPRLSLWYSLMDGCRLAVQKTTEEQSEDAKVAAARDPAVQHFRLDATSQLSVPKWGKELRALLEPALPDIKRMRKLQDGSITDKALVVGKKLWDLAAKTIGNGKTGEELHALHTRLAQQVDAYGFNAGCFGSRVHVALTTVRLNLPGTDCGSVSTDRDRDYDRERDRGARDRRDRDPRDRDRDRDYRSRDYERDRDRDRERDRDRDRSRDRARSRSYHEDRDRDRGRDRDRDYERRGGRSRSRDARRRSRSTSRSRSRDRRDRERDVARDRDRHGSGVLGKHGITGTAEQPAPRAPGASTPRNPRRGMCVSITFDCDMW